MLKNWDISEKGALQRLNAFIDEHINQYKSARDYPAINGTSKLAPYLHFGQISINHVWHQTIAQADKDRNNFV